MQYDHSIASAHGVTESKFSIWRRRPSVATWSADIDLLGCQGA
eukprot:SAG31_NODE_26466_length_441_cov_4.476608_1_plen_42_part_10